MNEEMRSKISSEEQQQYSVVMYWLREIKRKTKLEDDEYESALQDIVSRNDEQQLADFRNDYMSVSEFERTKAAIDEWMNELNEKYGVTSEMLAEERRVDASRKRPQLLKLKQYFESHEGPNILRDLDVYKKNDQGLYVLDDQAIIDLYDEVTYRMNLDALHAILNGKDFEGRLYGDAPYGMDPSELNDILNKRKSGGGSNGEPKPDDKNEIEKLIAKFKAAVEKITKHFNETQYNLVFGDINTLNVSDAIRGLEEEIRELYEEAKTLIAEMDAFRLSAESAEFSMSVKEIKATIKGFRDRLRKLKQLQIDRYNARVEIINRMIVELKGRTDLPPEVMNMINNLELISICGVTVRSWTQINYLDDINYQKLIEINNIVINIQHISEVSVDLESDILYIEKRIVELEDAIKDTMTQEEVDDIKAQIIILCDRTNAFGVKLNNNLDKNSPIFSHYDGRLSDAQANLADLSARLAKVKIIPGPVSKEKTEYDILSEKLDALQAEINDFNNLVDSLFGKVSVTALPVFETRLSSFESRLDTLKNEIETNKDKLDENQYNELMKKVEAMEQQLRAVREKIRDPKMVQEVVIKEMDIFDVLNGQIDGLEAAVARLEAQVEALEKPIKDKKTRKMIDRELIRLEEEARLIEQLLEKYKDEDPEKYQAAKERLDKIKERIEKVGKNYRKKCPLFVRAVKEAKNFYKKHKKLCLIIAGLAAIALLHATVGPVLIPAIMHGNIMMAYKAPFLRGIIGFINNILGNMIGAKVAAGGLWQLANGTLLSVSSSSASLLKGLAISGIGTTALLAPVVIAIKKLIEKMKKMELKKKHDEEQEVVEEKEKKGKKEKKKSGKKAIKHADKMSVEELAQLLKDYRASGMSLDEFCAENELSEEDKMVLQILESRSKAHAEELSESSRKGRR